MSCYFLQNVVEYLNTFCTFIGNLKHKIMTRKTSKQLFEELQERLENKSSEEICIYLGNYFSSNELADFLEFLEDEN